MLKTKLFYVASLCWIGIVALGFNFYFDQNSATQVPVVIALIGAALGWITVLVLKRFGTFLPKARK